MFVETEMLVYCNTKQFLISSFFNPDFMIGEYLIFIGFSKVHEFEFTRIKDHIIVIEPVLSNIWKSFFKYSWTWWKSLLWLLTSA